MMRPLIRTCSPLAPACACSGYTKPPTYSRLYGLARSVLRYLASVMALGAASVVGSVYGAEGCRRC